MDKKAVIGVLFLLLLTSCGGQSPVSTTNTGGTSAFTLSFSGLIGNWVRGLCVTPSSVRGVYRVVALSANTLQFSQDYIQYAGPNCTGGGTLMNAPSNLGTITFAAPEYASNTGFFRGDWTLPSTQLEKTIWGFKRVNMFCMFSDTTPTTFPNPQDVENYLQILADDTCFQKM